MAGRGFAPKDADKQLGHRTKAEQAATTIAKPLAPATAAPPALPDPKKLLAATRRWYATWCSSPQASQFIATDWQRLHMLALLVDAYFRMPSKEVLAEIRLNEAKLGATPDDRQRLHWKLGGGEPSDEAAGERRRPRSRDRKDPRHLAAVK